MRKEIEEECCLYCLTPMELTAVGGPDGEAYQYRCPRCGACGPRQTGTLQHCRRTMLYFTYTLSSIKLRGTFPYFDENAEKIRNVRVADTFALLLAQQKEQAAR